MVIGIIGCGGIAKAHITAISYIDEIRELILYDINRDNMEKLCEYTSLPITLCDNLQQFALLSDAFVICTPNHFHLEIAKEVIKYKNIPLLCEKPLAHNLDSANKLISISHPKSIVSFNYRYNSIIQRIISLKKEKMLGELIYFSAEFNKNSALTRNYMTWRDSSLQHKSSGALGDLSCHLLDLFCFLDKSKIKIDSLKIIKGTRVKHKENKVVEVDDNGYVLGQSINGTFFRIHASKSDNTNDLGLHINLIFEKGEIRYSTKEMHTIYLNLII